MNKKVKVNPYMIMSIVFAITIIFLGTMMYINQDYDLGNGFKVKRATINEFSKVMEDKPFKLCDTSLKNNCVVFGRIK